MFLFSQGQKRAGVGNDMSSNMSLLSPSHAHHIMGERSSEQLKLTIDYLHKGKAWCDIITSEFYN